MLKRVIAGYCYLHVFVRMPKYSILPQIDYNVVRAISRQPLSQSTNGFEIWTRRVQVQWPHLLKYLNSLVLISPKIAPQPTYNTFSASVSTPIAKPFRIRAPGTPPEWLFPPEWSNSCFTMYVFHLQQIAPQLTYNTISASVSTPIAKPF